MGCGKKTCENAVSVIISIILAVIVFFVFSASVVTGLRVLLYTIFGFSIFSLITLMVLALLPRGRQSCCICENGPFLLVGALGAIVFSVVTIALTVSTTVLAILASIVTLFTSLEIISLFLLVLCLVNANCGCRD